MFRRIAAFVLLSPVAVLAQADDVTYEYEVRGKSTMSEEDRTWQGGAPKTMPGCGKQFDEIKFTYYDKQGLLYSAPDKPRDLYIQQWIVDSFGVRTKGRRMELPGFAAPEARKPGGGQDDDSTTDESGEPGSAEEANAPDEAEGGDDPNVKWVLQISKLVDGRWEPIPSRRSEHDTKEIADAVLATWRKSFKAREESGKIEPGSLKAEVFPLNLNHLNKTYLELPKLPWVDVEPIRSGDGDTPATPLTRAEIAEKLDGSWREKVRRGGTRLHRHQIRISARDGKVEVQSYGGTGNEYYVDGKTRVKADGSFSFAMKAGFQNKQGDITGEARLDGDELKITMRRRGEVTSGTMVKEKD